MWNPALFLFLHADYLFNGAHWQGPHWIRQYTVTFPVRDLESEEQTFLSLQGKAPQTIYLQGPVHGSKSSQQVLSSLLFPRS